MMILMQPVTVKISGEVNVPILLENVADTSMFTGLIAGCGTKSKTDLLTVTVADAVPTTPFASRYVTVTGIVTTKLTFA